MTAGAPTSLAGKVVLVTGASGFIGSHLCRRLEELGAEVHGASRTIRGDGARRWPADLTDAGSSRELFSRLRPTIVFHLAGRAASGRGIEMVLPTFAENLQTTVNVLTAGTETGCHRIVLVGSLEEPDGRAEAPVPSSPYAAAKWACRVYARLFRRLYGTPVVIARAFMTYGPGPENPNKLIPYVIRSLLNGEPPRVSSGTRQIDWIYVDDLVEGLTRMGERPGIEGEEVDLGSGVLVSIRDLVSEIARVIGGEVEPVLGVVPDRVFEEVRAADTTATEVALGWRAEMSLHEGLTRTVAWYRRSGV